MKAESEGEVSKKKYKASLEGKSFLSLNVRENSSWDLATLCC
jgi:hypothetical protein